MRRIPSASTVPFLLLLASCALSEAFSAGSYWTSLAPRSTTQNTNNFVSHNKRSTELNGSFLKEEPTLSSNRKARDSNSELSAVAVATDLGDFDFFETTIKPVLSTAMLITGNTVGASALVLPDVAAEPGLSVSTMVFAAMFAVNLISGLLIAEVSIKQFESSKNDVPSSFKEFAEANLKSEWMANGIAGVSIFINACVLAFNLMRMGEVGSAASTGIVDATSVSVGFAALLALLSSTMGMEALSSVASVAVTGLFLSFGSLLLPGLTNIHDPISTLIQPGSSPDVLGAAAHAAPILLTSMVYQNIVPSVTKILDYDRSKTIAAVSLGSFIPVFIYWAWCFAVLGGGVDSSIGTGSPLMTAFSTTTVIGSSIACIMSIGEELESFFKSETFKRTNIISMPSVALSVGVPLAAGLVFAHGEDLTESLRYAGSYGSPLLYGAIPAIMAWQQRNKLALKNLVPGGFASLAALGAASAGFMWEEFAKDAAAVFS